MNLSWQFSLLSVPPLIAAGISITIAVLSWRKRNVPGSSSLASLLFAIAVWALFDALEISALGIPAKVFWSKIQYLGIASTPLLFLIFAARYSQQDHWLTRRNLVLLWIVPLITVGMAATNEWHGWHWSGFTLDQEVNLLTYHYGPWFWIWTTFAYLYLITGIVILIRASLYIHRQYRHQVWVVILAAMIPWVSNIIYLFGLTPMQGLDPTPIAFTATGLLLALSITEFHLTDITPIARSKLVDTIQDAIIVVNHQNRVVDLNPAALSILGSSLADSMGQPATQVLSRWPQLVILLCSKRDSPTETRIISDITGRKYDSRISSLKDRHGQLTGYLVILRDITEQKKAEAELARLATVVDQSNEAVVITDLDGNIVYVNPYFEKVTGYTAEEALGKNPHILSSGKHGPAFYQKFWDTITAGRTWEGIFINKHKNGSLYHQAATIFPIKGKNGKITNYAAVKRDITAQVQAEEAIQTFSRQLATLHEISIELSLTDTFDDMCQKAVELGYQHLGFDRMELWFVDPMDSDYLIGSFGVDEYGQLRDKRQLRVHSSNSPSPTKFLNENNRLFYQSNVPLEYDHTIIGYGELAVAGMWDKRKIIGYISVDNLISQEPITQQQQDILVLYGQILGNLSTRKRADEEIRNYARFQTLLNDITRAAIEQTDFQEMLQILADRMGALLDADGCYITLWDETNQIVLPGAASGPAKEKYHTRGRPKPGEPTLTDAVLRTGQTLVAEDMFNTPYISQRLSPQFPAKSMLALPLIANDIKLGAAVISFDTTPHQFTRDEIERGEQAAQQIALAILKTRLLEEAQRRATEAETLRQASAAVAATLNQAEAIERVLEELNRVVPYDSASVQLLRDDQLEIVGERGFEPHTTIGLHFPLTRDTPNTVVFKSRESYIIEDAPKVYPTFREPPHNHIRGWLGVPLRVHDKMIGMLALDSIQPGRFTPDHARLATAFADQVAIALENTRLFEETQWLAIHDSLTGLFNRRHFMALAQQEFNRSQRYEAPLSVIMLDIDHFKRVNDTHGHLIGDQVLQSIASLCKENLRNSDVIGRYGGEEFVILLPETSACTPTTSSTNETPPLDPAQVVAERLRYTIEQTAIETDRGGISASISLGVAELAERCPSIENLVDRADQALLLAKQHGRNQVIIWQPGTRPSDKTPR